MRNGILRNLPLLLVILGLSVLSAPPARGQEEDEETVEEIRKRIREEEEEAEEEPVAGPGQALGCPLQASARPPRRRCCDWFLQYFGPKGTSW